MKILEIYKKYKIPKNLQEHMERVACVGGYIADQATVVLDRDLIMIGALTHDLGNILKFDLDLSQKFFTYSPEEFLEMKTSKEYFQNIYGSDCEAMTIDILKKEGCDQKYIDIITNISFKNISELCGERLEKQILKYADMRVGLLGVVTLKERMDDARVRYPNMITEQSLQALYQIESNIFSHSNITAEDITQESTSPYLQRLENFARI